MGAIPALDYKDERLSLRCPQGDDSLPMTFYEQIRQEHWLRDKQDEGKVLILNDDSIWEVHPSDQSITVRWLRGSTIIVEQTETQSSPYLLRNRTEEETARANYLGIFRAAS